MEEKVRELAQLIARHSSGDGVHPTRIPRVDILRAEQPSQPIHSFQLPSVCLIAQGRKQVMLGRQTFEYDRSSYLVVSVDVPVVGQILESSPEKPYLCLRLSLEPSLIAELLIESGEKLSRSSLPCSSLGLSTATVPLLDAATRLLRVLDHPDDIPVLAPLAEREMLFWLLKGSQGAALRQIACSDSKLQKVNRAIQWLKQHYAAPFSMDWLASEAGMSPSALYQHFKAVTHQSPLQYQKKLRLQEARRLLLMGAPAVASIGHQVGYDSPSQFSREYSREFGVPPTQDRTWYEG